VKEFLKIKKTLCMLPCSGSLEGGQKVTITGSGFNALGGSLNNTIPTLCGVECDVTAVTGALPHLCKLALPLQLSPTSLSPLPTYCYLLQPFSVLAKFFEAYFVLLSMSGSCKLS
jgi:hypothetical protein